MYRLIEQLKQKNRRAIARLITLVENDEAKAHEAIRILYSDTGRSHIIGVTGPPGSGKSTLVNEIAKEYRSQDLLVGIIAVDPSSPFTGGALLGDRIRMRDLSGDKGIFIRSMASRGNLGGLAQTTGNVVKIMDAAGFEKIIVETVGAGQAEVDIAGTAHTSLVIEAPGMGDEIQTIKAGILEIADILVVNKADYPGAAKTAKALKLMLHMGESSKRIRHHDQILEFSDQEITNEETDWSVPVLETVAVEGVGIHALIEAITDHKEYLLSSGLWMEQELNRSRIEVSQLLQERFMAKMRTSVPKIEQEEIVFAVANREMDPYTAVDHLFQRVDS